MSVFMVVFAAILYKEGLEEPGDGFRGFRDVLSRHAVGHAHFAIPALLS